MKNDNAGGIRDRLRSWFPDREFFMRSRGQVRFVTLTSKVQMLAAGGVLAAVVAWGGSMAVLGVLQYQAQSEHDSLLSREAKVAKSESRVNTYRASLDEVADDLTKRQDFIESVLPMLPDDVQPDETVSNSSDEAQKTVAKVSASIPEASALARLEARQLAFVENLTRYADRRASLAEQAIRKLGLDPRSMISATRAAQGGPLEKLSTNSNGTIDPRFARLGASMARMDALERGLKGIPQVMPADINMISSGFGYRSDPFTGSAAMHAGLDFRGPIGAPVHAAAAGKVCFVGQRSGYGNVVEVCHGNGLMTRYAHMSRFKTKIGTKVAAGDEIGAIGSTGRSTGPHLHFEVRINGRAVNPRPFLESAPHVLEEARGTLAGGSTANDG